MCSQHIFKKDHSLDSVNEFLYSIYLIKLEKISSIIKIMICCMNASRIHVDIEQSSNEADEGLFTLKIFA